MLCKIKTNLLTDLRMFVQPRPPAGATTTTRLLIRSCSRLKKTQSNLVPWPQNKIFLAVPTGSCTDMARSPAAAEAEDREDSQDNSCKSQTKDKTTQVIVLENQILQDALKWAYQASPKHLNTR